MPDFPFQLTFSREAKKILKKFKASPYIRPERDWTFFDLEKLKGELTKIEAFAKPLKKKFPNIVVAGLGGAILGTKAIFEALIPFSANPRAHFLDNLDPLLIKQVFSEINLKKTLFIIVSKSGKTLETLTLFDIIAQKKCSIVGITEEKNSPLFQRIKKYKIPFYPHPKNIGGRFSVLTAVSMLPAALMGFSIKNFFGKAGGMSLKQTEEFSYLTYQFWKHKKHIAVFFPYGSRFNGLCEWYSQLIAESLGKNRKGITPLIAEGPKDQHSLLQLFLDGPKDKWFLFFSNTPRANIDMKIENIIFSEKNNVQRDFESHNIPFVEINFQELNESNLGALFYSLEVAVALLGKRLKINVFDQPAVDESKKRNQHLSSTIDSTL